MNRIPLIGLAVAVLLVAPSTLLSGAEKGPKSSDKEKAQGTVHTVEARVGYPTNAGTGIQAEKQPGSFTIPKGSKGAKLKYSFSDPKSDYTSTKLRGSNIYSVTEKRYMHELDHNPDFALPPGEYKFVVGGLPGASGTLNFRTFASTGVTLPPPGGDKRPPPTIRKPPPGGKSVVIRFQAVATREDDNSSASSQGTMRAKVLITGQRIVFDHEPGATAPADQVHRWEGTLSGSGKQVSVKGAVTGSASWQHGSSRGSYSSQGTFQGEMQGTTLKGTSTISTFYKFADTTRPFTQKTTMQWSIDGFDQVLSGR